MNVIYSPLLFPVSSNSDESSSSRGRFAIFLFSSPDEAKKAVSDAFYQVFGNTQTIVDFNEEYGELMYKEVPQDQSPFSQKKYKIRADDTIKLNKFANCAVLIIELFDSDDEPQTANMVIAHFIKKSSGK